MSETENYEKLSKKLAEATFLLHQMRIKNAQDPPKTKTKNPAGIKNSVTNNSHNNWVRSLRNSFYR